MTSSAVRRSVRLAMRLLVLTISIVLTAIVVVAWEARGRPDLSAWHTVRLEQEFSRRDRDDIRDLKAYLENEQRLFDEVREKVMSRDGAQAPCLCRYQAGSLADPQKGDVNFNRTRIVRTAAPRGSVLMLHGMTDSPYSLRHVQNLLADQGFDSVNLRLPGHGTTPGGLAQVDWKDWAAAVDLAADDIVSHMEPHQPWVVVGYSNGAALALLQTLTAIEHGDRRVPDQLILISPMIGISSLARVSKWFTWLGAMPFFQKALWIDLLPEYDPHKYNSFPNNGPKQSRALTLEIQRRLDRLDQRGLLDRLPPVLAFQSLVDATVDARAVFRHLYERLPDNGSELVMFDVNRKTEFQPFANPALDRLREELLSSDLDRYTLSLVVNDGPGEHAVNLWRKPAGQLSATLEPLGLAWPQDFYSLSHVALPFPPDDPVYGYEPPAPGSPYPWLGWVNWLGESGALTLPPSVFTRARANPFHAFMAARIVSTATGGAYVQQD